MWMMIDKRAIATHVIVSAVPISVLAENTDGVEEGGGKSLEAFHRHTLSLRLSQFREIPRN